MKKIICVVIAIILIVSGCLVAKKIIDNKKTIETSTKNNNVSENNTINKIENEIKNEVANNAVQNNVDPNGQEENNQTEPEEKDVNKTEEKKAEEKAIEIAKKDWGSDNSVYFSYEYKDNKGRYIISVREKTTTKATYWYTVDVETGKIID